MHIDRRSVIVLVAAVALMIPAGVLRALCVGRACERPARASSGLPFCSLPAAVRSALVDGFRDGRSPDLLAVAGRTPVVGGVGLVGGSGLDGDVAAAWPPSTLGAEGRVPLVFSGTGIEPRGPQADAPVLDAVAPTVADVLGLDRPHPEVRSGRALAGIANGDRPRLVVVVAWKGVGSTDLAATPAPYLERAGRRGVSFARADVGSLPLDPTAILTTVGTGGLPRQHGIVGTLVRDDRGRVTRSWDRGSPVSVIAALGDDLDRAYGRDSSIGLVATSGSDRGLIGGNWYLGDDRDRIVVLEDAGPSRIARRAAQVIADGFGDDDVPDLLGVAMEGDVAALDRALREVAAAAGRASNGSFTLVVTATGSSPTSTPASSPAAVEAGDIVERVTSAIPARSPLIEGAVPGGLFLDQTTLADEGISEDEVTRALRALTSPNGDDLFADVFPAITLTFARYC